MMQKLLLTLLCVLAVLPAHARDFAYTYEGQTLTYTVISETDKTCMTKAGDASATTGGNDVSGELVIPSVAIDGDTEYTVVEIGDASFNYNENITSVTIPETVTTIGERAFYRCLSIKEARLPSIEWICSVNFKTQFSNPLFYTSTLYINGERIYELKIPDTVTSIGDYAFYQGPGSSLFIPSSVTTIGSNAFANARYNKVEFASIESLCSIDYIDGGSSPLYYAEHLYIDGKEVTDLKIPDTVTSIGNYSFYNFRGLTKVTIPASVTSIGDEAFLRCTGLTEVIIGNSVTSIGKSAFRSCIALTSLNIPNSVTSIGENAFAGCSGVSEINIPTSVTEIKKKTFESCSGLTDINIPNSVTSIGAQAFYGCIGLTKVTIPESVTSLDNNIFEKCSNLSEVSIGKSVTTIGENAFKGCENLTKAEFASIESLCGIDFKDTYSNPLWFAEHLYIDGKEVTQVKIPDTVSSIGNNAFRNCSSLTEVTIPKSVTSIGSYAFQGCSGLSEITIPQSVTEIKGGTFSSCTGLTKVSIPESVTSIGMSAFMGCSALTEISIPKSVTLIEEYSFYQCSNLTKVEFGSIQSLCGIEFPHHNANPLYYVKHLYIDGKEVTDLKIPDSVTSISNYAFRNCSSITSLTIPNSVKSIGEQAFSNCHGLTEVTIPNSVTSIGNGAFGNYPNLNSITIGSGIETIGKSAFLLQDDAKIPAVYITAQNPPVIEENSFSDYSGTLYVQGEDTAEKYRNAAGWSNFKDIQVMTQPEKLESKAITITGKIGDKIQLTVTIIPANVTLPKLFWRSTNPKIATVDENGVVTLHVNITGLPSRTADDENSCKIIAETLYADGPTLEYTLVKSTSDIENIISDPASDGIDYSQPYSVYDLRGANMGDDINILAPGIYIIRQGAMVCKIIRR